MVSGMEAGFMFEQEIRKLVPDLKKMIEEIEHRHGLYLDFKFVSFGLPELGD